MMLGHLVLSRELASHVFSSLPWLWDALAKYGFVSCGVHALLLLWLSVLEMQTLLSRDFQDNRSIPPANPPLPSARLVSWPWG